MNGRHEKKSLFDELKRDYIEAREKKDFQAMREIYTELWKCDKECPYPNTGREEVVFFTEVLDDNSVVLPHELSEFWGKECCFSLFDERLDVTIPDEHFELAEKYLKAESKEFKKITIQDKFVLSPLACKSLKVTSGDILRIEYDSDGQIVELQIYNENDGLRFSLKQEE